MLGLVLHEFLHGLIRSGACREPVIVADHHAAWNYARIEKIEAIARRPIKVDINMYEYEFSICHFIKSFRNPTFVEVDILEFLEV